MRQTRGPGASAALAADGTSPILVVSPTFPAVDVPSAFVTADRSAPADHDAPPSWWLLLALPFVHFATVRLSFFCAVTPEHEVVVWLPNAVLLAALMRFRGRRGVWMCLATFTSDYFANLPEFAGVEAAVLSLINLAEILATYAMVRALGVNRHLDRVRDLVRFVVAGPLLSALGAACLASLVLASHQPDPAPFLTLMRVWWFGDALGLLLLTPLLLTVGRADQALPRTRWWDWVVLAASIALTIAMVTTTADDRHLAIAPPLLLPSLLHIAARFGVAWSSLAVVLLSLLVARLAATGHALMGGIADHATIVEAQELILTIGIVGLGFAVLLRELRANERQLEDKVRERTRVIEASNAKLATLSTTDGLTGVANRRHFDHVLAGEWLRAKRTGQALALVMLDIDLFKRFNDRYGHQDGDACLREAARVFQAHSRHGVDLVARYGGEEFAVIAPATDEAGATRLAASLRQALEGLGIAHADSPFGIVTVSLGVAALVPGEDEGPDVLLRRADAALYRAKAAGRNNVVLAEPGATTLGPLTALTSPP